MANHKAGCVNRHSLSNIAHDKLCSDAHVSHGSI